MAECAACAIRLPVESRPKRAQCGWHGLPCFTTNDIFAADRHRQSAVAARVDEQSRFHCKVTGNRLETSGTDFSILTVRRKEMTAIQDVDSRLAKHGVENTFDMLRLQRTACAKPLQKIFSKAFHQNAMTVGIRHQDRNSRRRLPIVIGSAEAESIAIGIEKPRKGRPHTHDLFIRFAKEFGIEIKEVVINRFRDGVYYAMLVCQHGNDLTMVDARPSDAIAIAVRLGCGICAYESVMEEASIIMDDMEEPSTNQNATDDNINKVEENESLDMLTLHELEDLLQEAIDNEDYAKAAQIRDEINGRKS